MERSPHPDHATAAVANDPLVGRAAAEIPARVYWARRAYLALSWLFVGCLFVQVFLAGMAVFVDPARWTWHTGFVEKFQYLSVAMLLVVFFARLSLAARLLTGGILLLILAQYVTANGGIPGAFHPVSGFLMLWVAINLAQRAFQAVRSRA